MRTHKLIFTDEPAPQPPECLILPSELGSPSYKMISRCIECPQDYCFQKCHGFIFFPGGPEHSLSENQLGYLQRQKAPWLEPLKGIHAGHLLLWQQSCKGCYTSLPTLSALSQFTKTLCPWVPPTEPELAQYCSDIHSFVHSFIHPSIHHCERLLWVRPHFKR